jgi:hypothetical protein
MGNINGWDGCSASTYLIALNTARQHAHVLMSRKPLELFKSEFIAFGFT